MAGRARVVTIRACRVPSCKANLIIFSCVWVDGRVDCKVRPLTHKLPQTADFWWGVFKFMGHEPPHCSKTSIHTDTRCGTTALVRSIPGWSRSSQL